MQIFMVIPFFKPQNNGEKWNVELGYLLAFGWATLFSCAVLWHRNTAQPKADMYQFYIFIFELVLNIGNQPPAAAVQCVHKITRMMKILINVR